MYGMELDNGATKQAYIQLLIDTSRKKLQILQVLADITEDQEKILNSETFDDDRFLQTISGKEEQLTSLTDLDDGFEQIYSSVKDELVQNKFRYETEIATLQEYITSITDLSVRLQAMEQRNKVKLEMILSSKRREIRMSKISSQSAANYYKTMTQQHETQSFFYDKKK